MLIAALLASLGAPTLPQHHGRVIVDFSISGVATRHQYGYCLIQKGDVSFRFKSNFLHIHVVNAGIARATHARDDLERVCHSRRKIGAESWRRQAAEAAYQRPRQDKAHEDGAPQSEIYGRLLTKAEPPSPSGSAAGLFGWPCVYALGEVRMRGSTE
jgi:hypothetical protein